MNTPLSRTGFFAPILLLAALLTACGHKQAQLPTEYTSVPEEAEISPDYKGIILPPNLAPLTFHVADNMADEVVWQLKGAKGELLTASEAGEPLQPDTAAWRTLLDTHRGETLTATLYAHRPQGWVRYADWTITVAPEDIDRYLSYRLIEPGYELYRQLGLYQRDLTNYEETVIYENNRVYEQENNHCINCHNYQAYDTRNMLFHVRANHGGTVVIKDGKAEKIALKHDSILTSGVYPTWHPTLPLVAFSTNRTGQAFHMKHAEKIEVLDEESDLFLYDAEAKTVQMVLTGSQAMETFPHWAPTGDRLYYCCAATPDLLTVPDSIRQMHVLTHYDSLHYNVMAMDFDPTTRRFGTPETVIDCAAEGLSASVPRVSPDGRFVLYTAGDYGQFHIWHRTSDLWVKDLTRDSVYVLTETSAPDAPDSYHTWSSNGRWIVFASRRDDGNFSRVYIAYFDHEGRGHKAFLLPQADPHHNTLRLKSYNVPELTRSAVRTTPSNLREVIYHTEGTPVTLVERK